MLEAVNLEVRRGEFVCIVGPSGCGKTTLLNVIGGFRAASRGEVLVDGDPVRRRVFIFQEGGVFPWLNVRENLGFGLDRRAGRDAVVDHYVDMVGLATFERSYPRGLSGGMRQRVEIARAPAALSMDEPFGALDYITRFKMRAGLVRIWQRERKTVLFVTHDVDDAMRLGDRVLVMSRRPATVREEVVVDLPRPRDMDSPASLACRERIFNAMGMSRHGGGLPA